LLGLLGKKRERAKRTWNEIGGSCYKKFNCTKTNRACAHMWETYSQKFEAIWGNI